MNDPKSQRWSIGFYESIAILVVVYILTSLVLPNFVEPRVGDAAHPPCIIYLREIDEAKQQWALENKQSNGVVASEKDITPYIKLDSKGNLPKCPQGGTYIIGKVGEKAACSLGTTVTPAHVLP